MANRIGVTNELNPNVKIFYGKNGKSENLVNGNYPEFDEISEKLVKILKENGISR